MVFAMHKNVAQLLLLPSLLSLNDEQYYIVNGGGGCAVRRG